MPIYNTTNSIDAAAKAIRALLAAIEGAATAGAAHALRSGITHHGRTPVDTVGEKALLPTLAQVRADAPDKATADTREAIMRAAWEGFMPKERATLSFSR